MDSLAAEVIAACLNIRMHHNSQEIMLTVYGGRHRLAHLMRVERGL